ncbi:MAG: aspartate aminotransferase family protein [Candidatus Caldatribacterium sp.]|uniref:aspartate aminotransferase family protein n=1 Tax=Candidatus Caldatribacterium sp. TaxID=2282143 RepID=UPI002995033F|nr:aspartate aminotransferase family protein [Candidatus Caldatribacterium sp.]MCX7729599.1 aspartate aminotransferase family protein [Candidatus Caldatribacterium sp.]MDW8080724.1 aspartate aminotransferase family protein [Candidatus Calescibacterium sp.]
MAPESFSEYIIAKEARYFLGTYQRMPAVFVRGEGTYLFDPEGNAYLDLLSGISVNLLGYGYGPLKEAIHAEVERVMHTSNLFYNVPQVELAEKLVRHSGFARVFFVNSGAEANEVALKMARFYGKRKYGNRYAYISFRRSFHGRTLLTLGVTGQEKFHRDLDPFPPGIFFGDLNDVESVWKVLSGEVCAIIVEPIQGEGGIYPCTPEFLVELRRICDERDILLIFDEVQCGMGRVGTLFAFQHFGVRPDIVTLAKGLGGGLPIGAVLVNEKIVEITYRGDHGSTFGGNPVAARSACVVVDTVSQDEFLRSVRRKGELLKKRLQSIQSSFPEKVKEVRGLGLMWGLEVPKRAKEVAKEMFARKVLVNACNEDTIRFLPPLVISEEDLHRGMDVLQEVLVGL